MAFIPAYGTNVLDMKVDDDQIQLTLCDSGNPDQANLVVRIAYRRETPRREPQAQTQLLTLFAARDAIAAQIQALQARKK